MVEVAECSWPKIFCLNKKFDSLTSQLQNSLCSDEVTNNISLLIYCIGVATWGKDSLVIYDVQHS